MEERHNIFCKDWDRRRDLRDNGLNGIDYIKVITQPPETAQYELEVHFIEKTLAYQDTLTSMLGDLVGAEEKFTIEGGVRVTGIRVTEVTKVNDKYLIVRVDRRGDFSTYTLRIDHISLDPAYSWCEFNFKAECPSDFDCLAEVACPKESEKTPVIDYLAKDYASFRQALIDLISARVPDWLERHEADMGIALVELLAYAGDHLSYYQDAIANETYLETARQKISVRRHSHLIDYRMHDGASARVFVHIRLATDPNKDFPEGTKIFTRISTPLGSQSPPHGTVLSSDVEEAAIAAAGVVFETLSDTPRLSDKLNEIEIYTWGNKNCCLPRGSTTADLKGEHTAYLKPGDFLLFEEVKSPATGTEADAHPGHRQIVRLTEVMNVTMDSLYGEKVTPIKWDLEDALTFPLCLSAETEDGASIQNVSVARGNLVLADHGYTVDVEEDSGPEPTHPNLRRAYRFRLKKGPLSFRIPLPAELVSARELIRDDSDRLRESQAQVSIETKSDSGTLYFWEPVPDLLDSNSFDTHFVPESDNEGRAVIRFGDGQFGMAPPENYRMEATYRVGIGAKGNVGAESLAHIIPSKDNGYWPSVIAGVRNPLPAWGGIDPEPIERVKELAPAAFHAEQFRAVTEKDYADAAAKHPEVSNAVATFRWTGSWHTVFITVDPQDRLDLPMDLQQRVKDWVKTYTQTGYDLEIDPPIFVPLDIEITVCVAPEYFRAHVKEAVLDALSNQKFGNSEIGFFYHENFTFGQPVYLSALYSAIEAVKGVDSAVITKFQRFARDSEGELDRGYISMNRLEVVRLDNNPNFPEDGVIKLFMRGGK